MPREHENQANQHDHQKNHYINKIISTAGDVRFGSKAGIGGGSGNVRFTPKSRHWLSAFGCPLCAKSRLIQCSKIQPLVGKRDK
jgi:hypothetical protein